MLTTIEYTYLDGARGECTGTWTGKRADAVVAAVEFLQAEPAGDRYRWHAAETGESYLSTPEQLAELGAALLDVGSTGRAQPTDVYSLWCANDWSTEVESC